MANEAQRVWRARKNHAWIDAQVRASESGTELRIFYDGDLVFSRSWPTRDAAVADAARQLGDLQRAGWNTHW
jgi:hypothetical protein